MSRADEVVCWLALSWAAGVAGAVCWDQQAAVPALACGALALGATCAAVNELTGWHPLVRARFRLQLALLGRRWPYPVPMGRDRRPQERGPW